MNSIQSAWEDYRKYVIAPDAGPEQLKVCRDTFYAGAVSVVSIQHYISNPGISETAAIGILSGIQLELEAFIVEKNKDSEASP